MNKKIIKSMLSVSGIILLAKVLGFVKQMITAKAFGATIQTDLISISEGFISNIDYLLIQALSTALIPNYILIKKEDEGKSKIFLSNVLKVFLVITLVISLITFFASPIISKILAPSYTDDLSNKLSLYIKILSPSLILLVEMAVFSSLLKANESFIPSELVGFNQSIILILVIILFGWKVGPDILIVGLYAYVLINLFFLMLYSKKYWIITKGNPFSDTYIKKILTMMGPLILGYSIVFVNQQVDKIIVSGLGEGAITAMGYAAVLSNFINSFVGSICGIMFTYVIQKIVDNNDEEAANLSTKSMTQIMVVLLPISILTILNSQDIVTIIFGRGKFDSNAIKNCSMALKGYGFIFIPFLIREMLSRFQYAYGDSKKPMINSSISIFFNVVLSIILSRFMGVFGVTVATSISVLLCAVLNYYTSKKINSFMKILEKNRNILRMIIGAFLCVVVSYFGCIVLNDMSSLIRLLIISITTMGIYFVLNKQSFIQLIKQYKK